VSDDQPTVPFDKLPYPSAQDAGAQSNASPEFPATDAPAEPVEDPAPRGWRARRRAAREQSSAGDPELTGVIPVGPAHEVPPTDEPDGADDQGDAAPVGDVPNVLASSARVLRRQRRRLVAMRDQMIFHLGGLAYELHLLGELQEPVAKQRAGLIYELDTTLEAIDAQLAAKGGTAGTQRPLTIVVGSCRTCRTPFLAESRYCMHCGAVLAPPGYPHPAAPPSAPKATT
jgi:hypothetical protein